MSLKLGILSFAHMHAHSYAYALVASPDLHFVGIADPEAARGREMAAQFGTTYYESMAALLGEGLDAVFVTSENVRHREMVEQAVEAGVKFILCEKPLATTVEDAQAMVTLCAARGVKLATAFPCRYSPAYLKVRAQVQAGTFGDILAIRGTNRGSLPGGWFIEKELSGGGAVIDHTVHVADLNQFLLGRRATEVYAEIGSGFYHQEWDDTGFLTMTYDGGTFATLDTSWSRPKTYPVWGDVTMQIIGTKGTVDIDMGAQSLLHYDDQTKRVSGVGWGSNADAEMIADFLRLANGYAAPILATGEDGLRALAVAVAAYRSSETGQPVAIG